MGTTFFFTWEVSLMEWLQSHIGSTTAMMVRCARYAIVAFVDFGVYPMLFKLEKPVLAQVRNV